MCFRRVVVLSQVVQQSQRRPLFQRYSNALSDVSASLSDESLGPQFLLVFCLIHRGDIG